LQIDALVEVFRLKQMADLLLDVIIELPGYSEDLGCARHKFTIGAQILTDRARSWRFSVRRTSSV
jgi:hypothetical protein